MCLKRKIGEKILIAGGVAVLLICGCEFARPLLQIVLMLAAGAAVYIGLRLSDI